MVQEDLHLAAMKKRINRKMERLRVKKRKTSIKTSIHRLSTIHQENDTENSGEDEDIWEEEKEKKKEAMAEWKGAGQLTM